MALVPDARRRSGATGKRPRSGLPRRLERGKPLQGPQPGMPYWTHRAPMTWVTWALASPKTDVHDGVVTRRSGLPRRADRRMFWDTARCALRATKSPIGARLAAAGVWLPSRTRMGCSVRLRPLGLFNAYALAKHPLLARLRRARRTARRTMWDAAHIADRRRANTRISLPISR